VTDPTADRVLDPEDVGPRGRYQLLTSLVVPRPIGWLSTWSADGSANLAPFSYFAALSSSPMHVGVSIGIRSSGPKDTLLNVRRRRAFCVNVVTESLVEAMNATAATVPPEVDEFELAGLEVARANSVEAPFVASCPAVLECELTREVDLGEAPNVLVVGQVRRVRLSSGLPFIEGGLIVDASALRPVGRLGGWAYAMPGEVRIVRRPR
jgi:flavin reductase (DIM6/NTAB) family NADH-FMN oxidoreductase RutF